MLTSRRAARADSPLGGRASSHKADARPPERGGGATLTFGGALAAALLLPRLHGASLYATILIGADLRKANLTRAKLTGADLTGADVSGASLAGTVLRQVRGRSKIVGLDRAKNVDQALFDTP